MFFGNYFSSPELLKHAKQEKNVWAVATLNAKRSRGCPILSDKAMKTKGRGFSQDCVDASDSFVVTVWCNRKRVLTASSYAGKEPVVTCHRYDRTAMQKIDVERLFSVEIYNMFIRCVNKADMLLSLYRTRYR